MSIKHGLLALLARGPAHGYQLKADFEEATGGAWTLNVGQVYTTLQRHERDGLATLAEDDGERRVYALTADGREALRAWLAEPVPRTLEDRDEVAMKVLLAAHAAGDARAVVDRQRAATTARIAHHTRLKAEVLAAAAGAPPPLATVVHLDRLILQCRAELDWLDLVERRLEDHAGPPTSRPTDLTTQPASTTTQPAATTSRGTPT